MAAIILVDNQRSGIAIYLKQIYLITKCVINGNFTGIGCSKAK